MSKTSVAGPVWPPLIAAGVLCWREMIRFFRQRNRVIGAVGQPLIFWFLFGAGLHQYFRVSSTSAAQTPLGEQTFQEYFFPGVLVLMVLFTAIFTTISVIEDRREGFLQSVLTAPIPAWSIVLGKVLGGSLISLLQALIFLGLTLLIKVDVGVFSLLALLFLLLVSAAALTSLGLVIAWRMDSTQGFHAIMTLVLMPMWLLSGAFFPIPQVGADAPWGQWALFYVMRANPLTYCVAGARHLLFSSESLQPLGLPSIGVCWIVSGLFAIVMFVVAWRITGESTAADML